MTTVAFDGKTLAVDSKLTRENGCSYLATKLFQINDDLFCAGAGDVNEIIDLYNYLIEEYSGGSPDDIQLNECEMIVFNNKTGDFWVYENSLTKIFTIKAPFAIGSGESYALSAMILGYDAIDAVKHASKLDSQTGEPVLSITINGKIKVEK